MAIIDNTNDLLLDDNSDFQNDGNGDFLVGDCGNRYIQYITVSFPGHYKEFPLIGIGIEGYLNAAVNRQILERDIIKQLTDDIFVTPDVDLNEYPPIVRINNVVIEKQ